MSGFGGNGGGMGGTCLEQRHSEYCSVARSYSDSLSLTSYPAPRHSPNQATTYQAHYTQNTSSPTGSNNYLIL